MGPSWGHRAAILGPSWASLGPLCQVGSILEVSWPFLGHLGAILGPSWHFSAVSQVRWTSKNNVFPLVFRYFCNWIFFPSTSTTLRYVAPSWAILGPSWAILGPSWGPPGAILGHPGPCWSHLGIILSHLGAILGHLGAILWPSWAILGSSWAILEPSWAILQDPLSTPWRGVQT